MHQTTTPKIVYDSYDVGASSVGSSVGYGIVDSREDSSGAVTYTIGPGPWPPQYSTLGSQLLSSRRTVAAQQGSALNLADIRSTDFIARYAEQPADRVQSRSPSQRTASAKIFDDQGEAMSCVERQLSDLAARHLVENSLAQQQMMAQQVPQTTSPVYYQQEPMVTRTVYYKQQETTSPRLSGRSPQLQMSPARVVTIPPELKQLESAPKGMTVLPAAADSAYQSSVVYSPRMSVQNYRPAEGMTPFRRVEEDLSIPSAVALQRAVVHPVSDLRPATPSYVTSGTPQVVFQERGVAQQPSQSTLSQLSGAPMGTEPHVYKSKIVLRGGLAEYFGEPSDSARTAQQLPSESYRGFPAPSAFGQGQVTRATTPPPLDMSRQYVQQKPRNPVPAQPVVQQQSIVRPPGIMQQQNFAHQPVLQQQRSPPPMQVQHDFAAPKESVSSYYTPQMLQETFARRFMPPQFQGRPEEQRLAPMSPIGPYGISDPISSRQTTPPMVQPVPEGQKYILPPTTQFDQRPPYPMRSPHSQEAVGSRMEHYEPGTHIPFSSPLETTPRERERSRRPRNHSPIRRDVEPTYPSPRIPKDDFPSYPVDLGGEPMLPRGRVGRDPTPVSLRSETPSRRGKSPRRTRSSRHGRHVTPNTGRSQAPPEESFRSQPHGTSQHRGSQVRRHQTATAAMRTTPPAPQYNQPPYMQPPTPAGIPIQPRYDFFPVDQGREPLPSSSFTTHEGHPYDPANPVYSFSQHGFPSWADEFDWDNLGDSGARPASFIFRNSTPQRRKKNVCC